MAPRASIPKPAISEEGSRQSDQAYRLLKDAIVRGAMPAGLQMLEPAVALKLGMSRTPVREALVRLEQEGFVDLIPRRGMRVAPLSPRDIREISEVLACLEVEAAGRLAAHGCPPEAMAALERAVSDMEKALRARDVDRWNEADYRFHALLVESCGNRHLIETARRYLEKAHRFRTLTSAHRAPPVYSNVNHAAVVEAIRRGDAQSATEIHRAHKRRWLFELDRILAALAPKPTDEAASR